MRDQHFQMEVKVSDHGTKKPQIEFAAVDIEVVDVNDNDPQVKFPLPNRDVQYMLLDIADRNSGERLKSPKDIIRIVDSDLLTRPLETTFPVVITTVKVDDKDKGDTVTFHLDSGDQLGKFAVDQVTGQVMVASRPEEQSQNAINALDRGCHVLKVKVKDVGRQGVVRETMAYVS